MSLSASISMGIAERYATALYDITRDANQTGALETDIAVLERALADSVALGALIASPIYSRAEQGTAMTAIAHKAGLSPLMANTLGLMAAKRRLFVLPQLLRALRDRIAADKNEVTAEIVTAKPLTDAQSQELAQILKVRLGKTVLLAPLVDQTLIGGMILKVGSKMIDTSIRAKLASLHTTMKEVG